MSGEKGKLAPWIPSTKEIIVEALRIANVGSGDKLYDLGAGDGRVTIIAAKDFGAKCVAIEIDERLCGVIYSTAKYYGLLDRIEILCRNFLAVNMSDATVVYMYLYKSINELLADKFEKELGIGTRIITIDFPIPGWQPIKIRRLVDRTGLARTIFLYVMGASNPKGLVKHITPVSRDILVRMSISRNIEDKNIASAKDKAEETNMD